MSLVDTASAGSWDSLKLSPFINETLQLMGFQSMTPVQASVIPLVLSRHKDVVVQAVTGSGKTLAFVIPLLEKLARRETALKNEEIGGVIICPTRELAIQTHKIVETFIVAQNAASSAQSSTSAQTLQVVHPPLLLVGGNATLKEDVQKFRSLHSDILIGTPGRLEEFLLGSSSLGSGSKAGKGKSAAMPFRQLRSACSLKQLEMLVLDEADRLLELGYTQCLNRILSIMPKQRRTGCFSATMSEGIGELCRVGLRNPVRVVVKVERKGANTSTQAGDNAAPVEAERNTPTSLQNTYVVCRTIDKLAKLLQLLTAEIATASDSRKVIVYFATCACVDYLYKLLAGLGQLSNISMYGLHGQQPPAKRTSTYEAFVGTPTLISRPHQVLLCTDVAARGLDLPDVDLVVQFDPPQDPKQFNHRAGRTARAGRSGKATVILCQEGHESEYPEFMKRRGVPLREEILPELPANAGATLEQQCRKLVLKDRDLHEKGVKAFVAFAKSYSKHEAKYIFDPKEYDFLGLAKAFALLRLPKMPELKAADRSTWLDASVDWDTYAFADKGREKQRQAEMAKKSAEAAAMTSSAVHKRKRGPPPTSQAWSLKVEAKEKREVRREKRAAKGAYLKSQRALQADVVESSGNVDNKNDTDDADHLAEEERAAKKVRRGKLAQEDFDNAFGGDEG